MGIIAAIKSLPMLIALAALTALGIYAAVERSGKVRAEALVEQKDQQLGAATASINQWHGAAAACSKATTDMATQLADTQRELDLVAAQKVKVVIQRETTGRALVGSADQSKSCQQAIAEFVASFQPPPPNLPTSAKMEVQP